MAYFICFFLFFLLISCANGATTVERCDRCVHQSKVTYFSRSSGLSSGACGYGSTALAFNAGHLAAAIPTLYNNGAGCGACYQMRCKNPKLCTKNGTTIIVTDVNNSNHTDFVISSRAFRAMANKGMDKYMLGLGVVDVEYKRIPCPYKKKNLAIRVEKMSKPPNYLAITLLYQGGQTEIGAVDVSQASSGSAIGMFRNYGAVRDTSNAPKGPLIFRLTMIGGADRMMLVTEKPIPADWKPGMVYDTGVQISAIKWEFCPTCDDGSW